MIDDYRPFPELAKPVLQSVLCQLNLNPDRADAVLAALAQLEPYTDAAPCLERLGGAGLEVLALTNGSEQNTRELLERSELQRHVGQVVSTDAVGAHKPHPAVYVHATDRLGLPAREVTLIAAHGWDVIGARAAGLGAIWVSRLERRWPLPLPAPTAAADLLGATELVLLPPR